jgi:hypothetical protein
MIPDLDMLKRYGKDAVVQASLSVDDRRDDGDAKGAQVWQRIVLALKEVEHRKPN